MPASGTDAGSKYSPSNKRSLGHNPVAHRPLRDRLVHLLALKPYKKPELLLWLERERASPKDKTDLTSVLEEVRLLANEVKRGRAAARKPTLSSSS